MSPMSTLEQAQRLLTVSGEALDEIAANMGYVRGPGCSDERLRARLMSDLRALVIMPRELAEQILAKMIADRERYLEEVGCWAPPTLDESLARGNESEIAALRAILGR